MSGKAVQGSAPSAGAEKKIVHNFSEVHLNGGLFNLLCKSARLRPNRPHFRRGKRNESTKLFRINSITRTQQKIAIALSVCQ